MDLKLKGVDHLASAAEPQYLTQNKTQLKKITKIYVNRTCSQFTHHSFRWIWISVLVLCKIVAYSFEIATTNPNHKTKQELRLDR